MKRSVMLVALACALVVPATASAAGSGRSDGGRRAPVSHNAAPPTRAAEPVAQADDEDAVVTITNADLEPYRIERERTEREWRASHPNWEREQQAAEAERRAYSDRARTAENDALRAELEAAEHAAAESSADAAPYPYEEYSSYGSSYDSPYVYGYGYGTGLYGYGARGFGGRRGDGSWAGRGFGDRSRWNNSGNHGSHGHGGFGPTRLPYYGSGARGNFGPARVYTVFGRINNGVRQFGGRRR